MLINHVCRYLLFIALLGFVSFVYAQDLLPAFDVHTHYKWEQEEVTSPQQALIALDKAGVQKAVVIGKPAEFALRLSRLAPDRIIPFYGPYLVDGEKLIWQSRTALIDEVRKGLSSGLYQGIGELHLIGGMAISWKRSKVFVALLELAREYNVPVMVHTEYSSVKPTLSICEENPNNRFLLAHAGAVIEPDQVEKILIACPNVVMDLSARDPWRYVSHPITDDSGKLLAKWHRLILDFSDRFMIGSDTVWPVDKGSSWDEPDTGWVQLPNYINFHRRWLSFLPSDIERKILWSNAERWFANANNAVN